MKDKNLIDKIKAREVALSEARSQLIKQKELSKASLMEVKILKESSTFSINSDGDVRTRAAGCRYEKVEGNKLTQVGGKVFTKVDGGSKSCIDGGAFDGMISSPDSNAYKLDVTGTIKGDATGNIDFDASAIYLN